ncbi:MAG: site-2 protease family protein [Ruminococcus sp.]|nr:site-2 protease family protein [Ruminococcus sp.]
MGILSRIFNLNGYVIIARIVIILLILPLHEFAHGWVARRYGDDTAEASGRLTLNPIIHMDPFGSVLLLLTGFGWAKPVPINPSRMNNPRRGIIWTSLAGPCSNLLAALVGMILLQGFFPFYYTNQDSTILYGVYYFLYFFISINISLAIFNLIPIPPLDGSNVLMALLPYRKSMWLQQHQQILSIILWVLILVGALSTPLSWLSEKVMDFLVWSTDWICSLVWKVM